MQFLFLLGRLADLSFAELSAMCQPTRVADNIASVELDSPKEALDLQNALGGTIKVARVVKQEKYVDETELVRQTAAILQDLVEVGQTKVSFGVAEFGRTNVPSVDLGAIKEKLLESQIRGRFVESPREGLSASVLLHQNVEEVWLVFAGDAVTFAYTIGVQNIDQWTLRDRRKPASDRKRGMLPPKLARMMLNLATGGKPNLRIYDPMCGTGTVLLEAMTQKLTAIGSDIRQEAVDQASANTKWLKEEYHLSDDALVFQADATHVTPEQLGGQVDAIVVEGLLGPQTPAKGALPGIFRGLEKLYIGTFKQWTKILKNGGKVCIALPLIEETGRQRFSLESVIDRATDFGYTTSSVFVYDRPDTVVKRQIFILKYVTR